MKLQVGHGTDSVYMTGKDIHLSYDQDQHTWRLGDVKRVELVWCCTNPSTDIISADAAKWVRAYPLDGERGQDVSRGSEHQIWGHVV